MRPKITYMKFSIAALVVTLLVLAGFAGSSSHSANAMQATMMSTMMGPMMGTMSASGPIPPCPEVMEEMMGTMEPGMMGTQGAMMGTMEPGMMGTMEPYMAGTMSAMMGTMDAMMAGMMSNACHYYAELSGAEEVPQKGAPDGKGVVELNFSRPQNGPAEVCYIMQVQGITLPAAASHIHRAMKGEAGPVVVPLTAIPDASGMAQGCAPIADNALLMDILQNPSHFYVNVHTTDFPQGAVRGQIEPKEMGK